MEILVNEKQYGGGGIFNDQATTSVDTAFAEYVFIHEFGHHFAALGDEYYTSPVSYETGQVEQSEPWEPNITALLDPSNLKWKDLMKPNIPLPTPWDKAGYEKHARSIRSRRTFHTFLALRYPCRLGFLFESIRFDSFHPNF